MLWYYMYGHLTFKGLYTLIIKNMVRGLSKLQSSMEVFLDCVIGKQQKDGIPKINT